MKGRGGNGNGGRIWLTGPTTHPGDGPEERVRRGKILTSFLGPIEQGNGRNGGTSLSFLL